MPAPLYTGLFGLIAFGVGGLLSWFIAALIMKFTRGPKQSAERLRELVEAQEEQAHWKHEYEEEARKRREVTGFIESIQKERDVWKNLYMTAGREHGVAQEIMMKKIEQLARIAKRDVPEELKALRAGFSAKHGPVASQKMSERIESNRLSPPPHLALEAGDQGRALGEFPGTPPELVGMSVDEATDRAADSIATADPSRYSGKP